VASGERRRVAAAGFRRVLREESQASAASGGAGLNRLLLGVENVSMVRNLRTAPCCRGSVCGIRVGRDPGVRVESQAREREGLWLLVDLVNEDGRLGGVEGAQVVSIPIEWPAIGGAGGTR